MQNLKENVLQYVTFRKMYDKNFAYDKCFVVLRAREKNVLIVKKCANVAKYMYILRKKEKKSILFH